MENKLSPIVLFVYNRPWHTLQTLESLRLNELADKSELFIYADGAKSNASEEDLEKIQETREIIAQNKWCGTVNIIESNQNKGLATSIIDGVTEVINKYGKIIVLEDDLILSKVFLKFMNRALTTFESKNEVMHVSGYLFPFKKNFDNNFFIKGGTSTWGWGTWKRAWDNFEISGKKLHEKISKSQDLINQFNYKSNYNYLKMLDDCVNGKNNSWGIRWYASVFLLNGLGFFPYKSLVENIGHDGSGMHCGESSHFSNNSLIENIEVIDIPIKENVNARHAFTKFYNSISTTSVFSRIKSKLVSLSPLKND
jgi:hypothetical protein